MIEGKGIKEKDGIVEGDELMSRKIKKMLNNVKERKEEIEERKDEVK